MNRNFLVFLVATILSSPAFAADSGSGNNSVTPTIDTKPRKISPIVIPGPVAKPLPAVAPVAPQVSVPVPPRPALAQPAKKQEDDEGFFGAVFKTAPVVVARSRNTPSAEPQEEVEPATEKFINQPPKPPVKEPEPVFVLKNEPMSPQSQPVKPAAAIKIPAPVEKPAVLKTQSTSKKEPKAEVKKTEPIVEVKREAAKPEVVEKIEPPKKPEPKPMEVKVEKPAAVKEVTTPKNETVIEEKITAPVVEKVEGKTAETPTAKVANKPAPKTSLKIEYSKEGDIERFRFKFSRPIAAAVFERFGYYWMAFDADAKADLPEAIKKSPLFESAVKVTAAKSEPGADSFASPASSPLIIRLALTREAYAMAERNGNEWLVEFDPNIKYEPEKTLKSQEKPEFWEVAAPGITSKITVKDEFTNDNIEIFPLLETGAIGQNVNGSNFVLEKTAQGVVIKPVGRVVTQGDEKDKIKIVKFSQVKADVAQPVEAEQAPVETPAVAPENAKPIFPFQKWEQLKPADYRKAEGQAKKGDILDYGKFLFTQELYPEAAVNLSGVKGVHASYLTGISYFMLGRFNDALKIFDTITIPADADPNELLLWRVAASYELSSTKPNDSSPPDIAGISLPKAINNYPDKLRARMLIPVIERMLAESRYNDAQGFLNVLPKTSMDAAGQNLVKYLQARIYAGQNKRARAREIWTEVEKANSDRESRAKSIYEIVMQDFYEGKITSADAAKRLNEISILWRGDIFEYRLLNQLGDLYAQSGQEYDALRTYKGILSSFPRFPENLTIASKMRDVYEKALEKNFSNKEKAFSAVTVYYEFEELKPVGPKGDQLTLQLADSLANFDLLEDAAKVLQKYSDSLSPGLQKAEIGTRITILHYLNNKPAEALKSLESSEAEGLPSYLVQERKILQIRCLIEMGDLEKAQSMLSSIPDEQANRFMTDIFWKQKKWQELIDVYGMIAQKSDEDIMRLAIANVLIGDSLALKELRSNYAGRMAKTPYAEKFDFVTDANNVDYRNLNTSLKLDAAGQVIKDYREKIKKDPVADNKPAKPAAAPANAPAKTPAAAPAAAPSGSAKPVTN